MLPRAQRITLQEAMPGADWPEEWADADAATVEASAVSDKKKRLARDVQALTGRTYCGALNLMAQWRAEGKNARDEIAKLAAADNDRQDAGDPEPNR